MWQKGDLGSAGCKQHAHISKVDRYMSVLERQKEELASQLSDGDRVGRDRNSSPIRTIKQLAAPDGPPPRSVVRWHSHGGLWL